MSEGTTRRGVDRLVVPVHCHERKQSSRKENKRLILTELDVIAGGGDHAGALALKHVQWNANATREGATVKSALIDRLATVSYACDHPQLSGNEIRTNTGCVMSRQAINNARTHRQLASNEIKTVSDLIASKSHHLLADDGEDVLIFGMERAIEYLASTSVIFADGTFKCVLSGYAQLYIIHAIVENDVSLPMLFCLLRRKDEDVYLRLLRKIEEMAKARNTKIFKRKVRVMCDFERAFINAVSKNTKTL